jgi:predicted deacylase
MNYFSTDYFTARSKLITATNLHNGRLKSYQIDAELPLADELTIDVAIFGNPDASKAVVISSGLHGVEGLFGSAVQLATIDRYLAKQQLPADIKIVMIHILNPFGCACYRRWNEDNIDLNRNFLNANETYTGAPLAYRSLDSFLNPPSSPSRFEPFVLKSLAFIGRYGMSALKSTLPVGQYEFPKGLFFGGSAPAQTQRILAAHFRSWLGKAQQVIHLDLHSGLGKWGTYQLFAEMNQDTPRYQWLSEHFEYLVALDSGDLVYQSRGTFGQWCKNGFGDLSYDFLLAEFGTYPILRVLKALRAENRAHWWGKMDDKSYAWAKQELLEVFVPQNSQWRETTLNLGVDLCLAAIDSCSDLQ